jgi:hypothetical protein
VNPFYLFAYALSIGLAIVTTFCAGYLLYQVTEYYCSSLLYWLRKGRHQ